MHKANGQLNKWQMKLCYYGGGGIMANIYYSDMDGTLLNAVGRLESHQRERLRRLLLEGVQFSVATGRNMHMIRSELKDLPIVLPVIENNGSYLTDYQTGEKLVVNYFPHDHLREIINVFMGSSTSPMFLLIEDGVEITYASNNQLNEGMLQFREFRRSLGEETFELIDDLSGLPFHQLVNLQAVGREDEILELTKILETFPERYEVHAMNTYDGWWYANIASHDSSKAHGLELVRQQLKPEDQIIVFGDNVNDIPMLKVADISIAVNNALPMVKQAADIVIGNHGDGAVIDFIEQHRDKKIVIK